MAKISCILATIEYPFFKHAASEKVLISKLCFKNGIIISELQEVELGYKVIYICDLTGKFTRTCIMCNDNSSQRGEWSGTKPECVLSVKKGKSIR